MPNITTAAASALLADEQAKLERLQKRPYAIGIGKVRQNADLLADLIEAREQVDMLRAALLQFVLPEHMAMKKDAAIVKARAALAATDGK